MTDLTALTLNEAKEGLAAKSFTSLELTNAHLAAMEKARVLNAYVLETPDQARAMAKDADAKLAKGEGGNLLGIPLGIKDLFATKDARMTACSKILDDFKPPYESTVTLAALARRRGDARKLNNDEFAMGSSNETSAFGPVINPWRREGSTPSWCPAARRAARLRRWQRACVWARPARTLAARSASRRRSPASLASSRPMAAARAGASSPSRPRWIRPGRSRAPCATPPILLRSMAGHDPKDTTSVNRPVPDYESAIGKSVKGMKIGIPKEYRIEGMSAEIEKLWTKVLTG